MILSSASYVFVCLLIGLVSGVCIKELVPRNQPRWVAIGKYLVFLVSVLALAAVLGEISTSYSIYEGVGWASFAVMIITFFVAFKLYKRGSM